jgi:hypothetical protein
VGQEKKKGGKVAGQEWGSGLLKDPALQVSPTPALGTEAAAD